jgi:hypothetical protein
MNQHGEDAQAGMRIAAGRGVIARGLDSLS